MNIIERKIVYDDEWELDPDKDSLVNLFTEEVINLENNMVQMKKNISKNGDIQ